MNGAVVGTENDSENQAVHRTLHCRGKNHPPATKAVARVLSLVCVRRQRPSEFATAPGFLDVGEERWSGANALETVFCCVFCVRHSCPPSVKVYLLALIAAAMVD